VADSDVPRVCDGAAPLASPVSEISRHSNGEPVCAIRCTRRTPRDRDRAVRPIGEAKDAKAALVQALAALRHSPKTWAAQSHQ